MEAPRRKDRRRPIERLPLVSPHSPIPGGFELRVMSADLKYLYLIPSELMLYTTGLQQFSSRSPADNSRASSLLQLCTAFNDQQKCVDGDHCLRAHCRLRIDDADVSSELQRFVVHLNDVNLPSDRYPRFSSAGSIEVCYPNTSLRPQIIPLTMVFATKGVENFIQLGRVQDAATAELRSATVKLQHCAHFAKHGMCQLGPNCNFVHALHATLQEPQPPPVATRTRTNPVPEVYPTLPRRDPWGMEGALQQRPTAVSNPQYSPVFAPALSPFVMLVPVASAPERSLPRLVPAISSHPITISPAPWNFQPGFLLFPPSCETSFDSATL